MGLTTRLLTKITGEQTATGDNATGSVSLGERALKEIVLLSGTGADAADRMWAKRRTVAASTTDSIDVSGSLVDSFNNTVAFAKVKAVQVINRSTTQTLSLTRPAANGVPIFTAAGDTVPIPPGGFFMLVAPGAAGLATVTAGTGDLIDIVNPAGGSADYDICIIGTSA
jgi:hypothetical protein